MPIPFVWLQILWLQTNPLLGIGMGGAQCEAGDGCSRFQSDQMVFVSNPTTGSLLHPSQSSE